MHPKIWGPGGWLFLHSITLNYPENPTENDKMYHKNFFLNLQNVLPCPNCAKHYSLNLTKFPIEPALENKELFVKWLIDIHNEVNKKNFKRIYTYDEVIQKYDSLYNGSNMINNILIVIVLGLLFYFIYREYL